jgi:dipeptidyl aminopeptidase/acylaminoacyl peptidase
MRYAALLLGVGLVVTLAGGAAGARAEDSPLPVRVASTCAHACPGDRSPEWSPDGARIAFLRYVDGPQGRHQAIFTMAANGGYLKRVFDHGPVTGPYTGLAWSPDSSALAASASGQIWVFPVHGAKAYPVQGSSSSFPAEDPQWSPDGKRIAFTRYTLGPGSQYGCCEIWVSNLDGSGAYRVAGSFDLAWADQPRWSRDGRLAYVTGPRGPDGAPLTAAGEVHVAKVVDRLVLPAGSAGPPQLLGWSRYNDVLVARQSEDHLGVAIETVHADGTGSATLVTWPATFACCWLSPWAAGLTTYPWVTAAVAVRSTSAGDEVRFLGYDGGSTLLAAGVSPQANVSSTASWSPDATAVTFTADGECATLIGIYVWEHGRSRRITNPCHRAGTPRTDSLVGTSGPDAVYGRGGNDRLDGGPGPDYVDGGTGDDLVRGDAGDDRLIGGRGRDRISGGTGWDRIYARDGARDTIDCGPGRDGVRADRLDRVAGDCEVVQRG